MLEAVVIWAYVSPMPFAWCRVFFGLRGHRALLARWVLASAIALVWPLFAFQYARCRRHPSDVAEPADALIGDQIEAEFHQLYP